MLFNSGLFLQFFAAFLLLYYLVRGNLAARNLLIVAGSYVFYGAWDYRFLGLLVLSSLIDYAAALAMGRSDSRSRRKLLLSVSIVVNLGIFGFFKYYGFFVENFAELLRAAGLNPDIRSLNIVLPVGISFYTFQTMSYTIDVYRGVLPPSRNLVQFLAYVSFFPQLVAGPIERATQLLPQFNRTVVITGAMLREGIWLCLWGMFKKVVVSDNLAPLVEMVYGSPNPTGPMVLLGTCAFALQIYGDFSGYSDIARGTARMLGFDIMLNFNLPYTARSMREFWGRWHISLSTWLRDYLYIPLGGNRRGVERLYLNLLITMLLGGLWHGARWNFILWGAWHGLALVLERRFRNFGWLLCLLTVLYGWMLFRAESIQHLAVLHASFLDWSLPAYFGSYLINLVVYGTPLVAMEFLLHRSGGVFAPLRWRAWRLGVVEGLFLTAIVLFWAREKVPFIYFQF